MFLAECRSAKPAPVDRRRRRGHTKRFAHERGAATFEHLGVVSVVALLIGVGIFGVASYGPQLSARLCELADGMGISAGVCEESGSATAESTPVAQDSAEHNPEPERDFRPSVCLVSEQSEKTKGKINLGFIAFGGEAGFTITEYSDGTVEATVTDGTGIAVEGGAGAEAGTEGVGIGAKIDFGAGVYFENGSTYKFADMEDFGDFKNELFEYQEHKQNAELMLPKGYETLGEECPECVLAPPKDPSIVSSTIELNKYADAQAGLMANIDGVDHDLNRGVYAEGEVSGAVTRTHDRDTNEKSDTLTFSAEGGSGLNSGFINFGGEKEADQALKITRNAQDDVISVEFMRETTSHWTGEINADPSVVGLGNGESNFIEIGADKADQLTVLTTELVVDESNRSTVDSWLKQNSTGLTGGVPLKLPKNAFDVSEDVPGDPMAELLFDEGVGVTTVYDNVEKGFSFAAEFSLGLKVGASFSSKNNKMTVHESFFNGPPQTEGRRGLIPNEVCDD